MRFAFLLTLLAGAAIPVAASGAELQLAPRPISAAERAALELAADFAARGPEAIWERLDPAAPLATLGHDAALREISARLGTRSNVTWTLQTPVRSFGDRGALFHLEFPSGAEDLVRLEFATPGGGRLRHLWTLVDRPEISPADPPEGLASTAGGVARARRSAGPFGMAPGLAFACLAGFLLLAAGRWRRPTVRVATMALLAACSPGAPAPRSAAPPPFAPRLGELAGLRLAFTAGHETASGDPAGARPEAPVPAAGAEDPAAERVAELWRAESALTGRDLRRAEELLGPVRPEADPPLASLLRARLAGAHFRPSALTEFAELERSGFASDQGALERVVLATVLEDDPLDTAAAALASGSRLAELWYLAAAEAVAAEQGELAEARMRTAWSLRPLPRDEVFAQPGLAALAARPSLFPLFELGSPAEPVVSPAGPRRELDLPAGATGTLCGRHYSIRIGDFGLEIPGGGELAPAATPVRDAATFRAQAERRALATLAALPAAAVSASPARIRLAEDAARALAREGRWPELLAITGGDRAAEAQGATEMLARYRALALRQLGRDAEATAELVGLARAALAGRRPFPGALYDLAELLAADGRYDTAIRLVEKADAQLARPFGEARIRQLELSRELESDLGEYRSTHFTVHFPAGSGERYGRQIATVLEEERQRLMQWIPPAEGQRVIVELLPLESFLSAYAGEVPVIGLYDGRIRMPLADIRSLAPEWIAIVSHELTHALLTRATRGRAPHWLQEGLAQYAEMGSLHVNPMPELEASGRTLSFPALEPILRGFSEPQLVELAYSEAAWVVGYIESRGGAAAVRRLVGAFAGGASTERATAAIFGQDLPTFDRAFRDWAARRAPAKRLVAARRFDRELDLPFAAETSEAAAGRSAVRGIGIEPAGAAPPPTASESAAMQSWHRDYLAAAGGARAGYERIAALYRTGRGTPAPAECAELRRQATDLVRGPGAALGAPVARVADELHRAYESLARFGELCEAGRAIEALEDFDRATRSFRRARTLLEPFDLSP